MTDNIDGGSYAPGTSSEVVDSLNFYFNFDSDTSGDVPLSFSGTVQTTFNDISSGKILLVKLLEMIVQLITVWTGGDFKGWSGATSPEALVQDWFTVLGEQAVSRVGGVYVVDADTPVYVTPEGLDINQLTQKFLLGAITFSQGADDYLDDDVDGKGLKASNIPEDGKVYSGLAHAWDEGFGYYGAARNFLHILMLKLKQENIWTLMGWLQDLKTEKTGVTV